MSRRYLDVLDNNGTERSWNFSAVDLMGCCRADVADVDGDTSGWISANILHLVTASNSWFVIVGIDEREPE